MMARRWASLAPRFLCGVALPVAGQGHGPVYGLSTPTLGRGGWSLDVAVMGRSAGSSQGLMLRPMVSYGVTADLQVSASIPLPLETPAGMPQARGMSRMPTSRDAEVLLGWRFHRNATGIGSRFESTAYLGTDVPLDERRSGTETAPAIVAAVVTGYASRGLYVWVGGLRRQALPNAEDRLGHLTLYSAVTGLRPAGARVELLGSVAERVATETTPPAAVMTLTVPSGGAE